jgi:pSer/pThr/pTyr-binding forkhead associated (FHA) protein
MLTILLKFNERVLKTIETDKEVVTVGRNTGNDIHIDNLSVSKQHARIVKEGGNYIVEDLKSTNGTYLNSKQVSRSELKEHDLITVGKHTLEILFSRTGQEAAPVSFNDTMIVDPEKRKAMMKQKK